MIKDCRRKSATIVGSNKKKKIFAKKKLKGVYMLKEKNINNYFVEDARNRVRKKLLADKTKD